MHYIIRTLVVTAAVSGATSLLPGCGQQGGPANSSLPIANDTAGFASLPSPQAGRWAKGQPRVVVVVNAERVNTRSLRIVTKPAAAGETGESIVDLASPNGLANYINAQFPHDIIRQVVVQDAAGHVLQGATVSSKGEVSTSVNASAATFALGQHIQVPPPGVSIDHTIRPVAPVNASAQDKADAVVTVASDLEGTPNIWGHNADRGEAGFDCSNFVSYVYHHALGYQMNGNSNAIQDTVGVTVPKWDMRKGDLLIFDNGRHLGIYLGNDEMIQCGGGLGKVGVLPLGPDSEWGKHLSAVRRMF